MAGFYIASSVLSLRPAGPSQPVLLDNKGLVAYNGEIYGIGGSDTEFFAEVVSRSVIDAVQIEGEFAFVYCDGKTVYFGRDRVGRRSLLYSCRNGIVISSTADTDDFVECQARRLYVYDLSKQVLSWVNVAGDTIAPSPYMETMGVLTQLLTTILERSVVARAVRPQGVNISVLFSGGLDCTVLARLLSLADPHLRISLVNVAFENRRINRGEAETYNTPDRNLARASFEELAGLAPGVFRLKEVNVSYEEMLEHKKRVVRLIYPAATVMDFSIAVAFYFAARAAPDPIIISGLGADELFGGYSRHVSAAARSCEDLAAELAKDLNRIGSRNLGRDDRVCADWGREVRYPYLDKDIIDCAVRLPPSAKISCGETKHILRELARGMDLGVSASATKRAIQFGARSAKMDVGSGRARGTDRLLNNGS